MDMEMQCMQMWLKQDGVPEAMEEAKIQHWNALAISSVSEEEAILAAQSQRVVFRNPFAGKPPKKWSSPPSPDLQGASSRARSLLSWPSPPLPASTQAEAASRRAAAELPPPPSPPVLQWQNDHRKQKRRMISPPPAPPRVAQPAAPTPPQTQTTQDIHALASAIRDLTTLPELRSPGTPLSPQQAEALANGTKVLLLSDYTRGTSVVKNTVGEKTGFNRDTGNMVVTFGSRTGACPRPQQLALFQGSHCSGDKIPSSVAILAARGAQAEEQAETKPDRRLKVAQAAATRSRREVVPAAVVLAADLVTGSGRSFSMADKLCFEAWNSQFRSEVILRELARRWVAVHPDDPLDAAAAVHEGELVLSPLEDKYLEAWKSVVNLRSDHLLAFVLKRRKSMAKTFGTGSFNRPSARRAFAVLMSGEAGETSKVHCAAARAWARVHAAQFCREELRIQWEEDHGRSSKGVKDKDITEWLREKEYGVGEWACIKCRKRFETPSQMHSHLGMEHYYKKNVD